MDIFGKVERQNPDWFEAGIAELEPAIEAKRAAVINYKREPSEKSLAALRKARNDAQQSSTLRLRLLAELLVTSAACIMP